MPPSGGVAARSYVDVQADDEVESIEQQFEILDIDPSNDDDPGIITIDDDDLVVQDDPNLQSSGRLETAPAELRNGPITLPEIEVTQVILKHAGNVKVHAGDTVELEDEVTHEGGLLHSGDFLRVKHIVKNVSTGDIRLTGYRLRRNKYLGQIFDWRINELAMVLHVRADDDRSPFIQGMDEVPLKSVIGLRECFITNMSYPLLSCVEQPQPSYAANISGTEWQQIVYHTQRLICRNILILTMNKRGKSYAGSVRAVYAREADTPPRPSTYRRSPPQSNGSSTTVVDDDDDIVIIAPKRARSDSLEELSELPRPKEGLRRPVTAVRYTFADVFCGAGGASQGAVQAGLAVLWGLDKDELAIEAWRKNNPSRFYMGLEMDAHDFVLAMLDMRNLRVHILHLSPPCCYFSSAKTTPGKNDQANFESIFSVGPILNKVKPRIVTLEQTTGLLTGSEHNKVFRMLLNDMRSAGYDVRWKLQYISDFGLAQRRQRLLLVGARRGKPIPPFPRPTHGPPGSGLKPYVFIHEALRPLANLQATDSDRYHRPELCNRISKEPYDAKQSMLKGCITTSGGQDNHHPSGQRRFTARELALLQSFPLKHQFVGSVTEAKKQAGNAFPPIMGKSLYTICAQTLEAYDNGFLDGEPDTTDLEALLRPHGVSLYAPPTAPNPLLRQQASSRSESTPSDAKPPFRYLHARPAQAAPSRSERTPSNAPRPAQRPRQEGAPRLVHDLTMPDDEVQDLTMSDGDQEDETVKEEDMVAYETQFWQEVGGALSGSDEDYI